MGVRARTLISTISNSIEQRKYSIKLEKEECSKTAIWSHHLRAPYTENEHLKQFFGKLKMNLLWCYLPVGAHQWSRIDSMKHQCPASLDIHSSERFDPTCYRFSLENDSRCWTFDSLETKLRHISFTFILFYLLFFFAFVIRHFKQVHKLSLNCSMSMESRILQCRSVRFNWHFCNEQT